MDGETCLELALEGERLCKVGDFNGGIAFFEAALKLGTKDKRTLSAVYSQLGNAHFYLGNYEKALDYHKLDLSIAKSMEDEIGEGKASGNLGNTLKMLGKFDEAELFCQKHLEISVKLSDQVGEGRALYNLGNVYHTKSKQLAKNGNEDPGNFSDDIKEILHKALQYYDLNLKLMTQLGDKVGQGRAYGNLGNTHYLLGNFAQAISYHKERLNIAKEFGDKAAQRRAHCNLGNANIFLGNFENAVDDYEEALKLAVELKDQVIEAQACFSLGNTYTLLRNYEKSIHYHLRHLKLAQQLNDQLGEGKAYWSLGNALTAIGSHGQALDYAKKYLTISKLIGDKNGELTAQRSITNIENILATETIDCSGVASSKNNITNYETPVARKSSTESIRRPRFSMENMEILKLTPGGIRDSLDEVTQSNTTLDLVPDDTQKNVNLKKEEEDKFFDLLERFQSKRMDDQRCAFKVNFIENKENRRPMNSSSITRNQRTSSAKVSGTTRGTLQRSVSHPDPVNIVDTRRSSITDNIKTMKEFSKLQKPATDNCREELFDMIAGLQSRRMDEQRAQLPPLTKSNDPSSLPSCSKQINSNNYNSSNNNNVNLNKQENKVSDLPSSSTSTGARRVLYEDDEFFDLLIRCQASRLEEQRSVLPQIFSSNGKPPGLHDHQQPTSSNASSSVQLYDRGFNLENTRRVSVENHVAASRSTIPDEDFISLIIRFQSGRMEDQRSHFPVTSRNNQENSSLPNEDKVLSGEND